MHLPVTCLFESNKESPLQASHARSPLRHVSIPYKGYFLQQTARKLHFTFPQSHSVSPGNETHDFATLTVKRRLLTLQWKVVGNAHMDPSDCTVPTSHRLFLPHVFKASLHESSSILGRETIEDKWKRNSHTVLYLCCFLPWIILNVGIIVSYHPVF